MPNDVYHVVGSILQRHVEKTFAGVSSVAMATLRRAIKKAPYESVDYEIYGPAFALMYSVINYWKAVFVLQRLRPFPIRTVADLGCGSGATAVATIAYVNDIRHDRPILDLLMVDRSPRQLSISREIVSHVLDALPGHRIHCRSRLFDCSHPGDWKFGSHDVVWASHLITENPLNAHAVVDTARAAVRSGGRIILIERPDDEVWRSSADKLLNSGQGWTGGVEEIRIPNHPVERAWRTSWCSTPAPGELWVIEVVHRYFRAWRERSVEILSEVFSLDAQYQEKPFSPPIRGLRAIEDYWRREVLTQENLFVDVANIAYTSDAAFVEWEAQFSRDGISHTLRGLMLLECNHHTRRIHVLREYFHTHRVRTNEDSTADELTVEVTPPHQGGQIDGP